MGQCLGNKKLFNLNEMSILQILPIRLCNYHQKKKKKKKELRNIVRTRSKLERWLGG